MSEGKFMNELWRTFLGMAVEIIVERLLRSGLYVVNAFPAIIFVVNKNKVCETENEVCMLLMKRAGKNPTIIPAF